MGLYLPKYLLAIGLPQVYVSVLGLYKSAVSAAVLFLDMDSYDSLDRPLFGVSTRRERLLNLVVGAVVTVFVVVTIILSFAVCAIDNRGLRGNDVFFGLCITLVCASLLILIHWYREGDVDPKFKKLIYFNSASVVLLCICANVYFFRHCDVSRQCNVTIT